MFIQAGTSNKILRFTLLDGRVARFLGRRKQWPHLWVYWALITILISNDLGDSFLCIGHVFVVPVVQLCLIHVSIFLLNLVLVRVLAVLLQRRRMLL